MTRAVALCMLVALSGLAQDINIPKPADREFLVDRAFLVNPSDKDQIMAICDGCLRDRAIPIVVVTVPSMAECTSQSLSMEAFARNLFNQWEIGYRVVNGVSWNRGILFVISRADRKARIQLGRDWHSRYNSVCASIMEGSIIPHFRRGDYSAGIRAGVGGLDAMARGLSPPASPWGCVGSGIHHTPPPVYWVAGIEFLIMFIVGGIYRRYGPSRDDFDNDPHHHRPRQGQASFDDSDMSMQPSRRSTWDGLFSGGGSSHSSFSGGSFGGGSSGGGGATGSW